MIIHNNCEGAVYFAKGIEFVNSLPVKKSLFSKKAKVLDGVKETNIKLTLISNTQKESLEFISDVISKQQKSGIELNEILVVIVDYFKDSMIRDKYIKGKLLRGNKSKYKPEFVFVEFNEMDKIIQIEDEYNQCFSYKDLSRHYKKQLNLVSSFVKESSGHESVGSRSDNQEKPLKKGGKKLANSTLV